MVKLIANTAFINIKKKQILLTKLVIMNLTSFRGCVLLKTLRKEIIIEHIILRHDLQ